MDFQFDVFRPGPPVDAFVASIWRANGRIDYARERILPVGQVVMLVNLGSPFKTLTAAASSDMQVNTDSWICGVQTEYMINEPVAETNVVGVSFKPWGAYPFFRLPMDELADLVVPAEAVWPAHEVAELRSGLADAESPAAQAEIMAAALTRHLDGWANGLGLARHAVEYLTSATAGSVGELADEIGISHKHLITVLKETVGVAPKTLLRIAKLNRLLAAITPDGPVRWDHLAHDFGYYDQAHFNRDFLTFTGVTPTQYLAQRRAIYGDLAASENASFVPFR
ncbi:MAG: AraC family transcriptional regulator [Sphingomonadales bacterium]|nr:AraC family transcriptional regulator [Sphingomonadales bacterium]